MIAALNMRRAMRWCRYTVRRALSHALWCEPHQPPQMERDYDHSDDNRNQWGVCCSQTRGDSFVSVRRACAVFACLAIAACGSSAPRVAPEVMTSQPVGARGQATDYSVASRDAWAAYAGLLPQGVAASAIRLGNDRCYYYVAGAPIDPLTSTTGGQVCL